MSPQDESQLCQQMNAAISQRKASRALELFLDYSAYNPIRSAHTYFAAALAASLRDREALVKYYKRLAAQLPDYSPEMAGDFLRDLANLRAKRGQYSEALDLLSEATVHHVGHADKWCADMLIRGKVQLYQGRCESVSSLEDIRDLFIIRDKYIEKVDAQYARNASWWLLLASARFNHRRLFEAVAADMLDGRMRTTRNGTVAVTDIQESASWRRQICMLLLASGPARPLLARALIWQSRR